MSRNHNKPSPHENDDGTNPNRSGKPTMSAFAESAYAHATRDIAPSAPKNTFLANVAHRIRRGGRGGTADWIPSDPSPTCDRDYNLLYYPDSTSRMVEGTVVMDMEDTTYRHDNGIVNHRGTSRGHVNDESLVHAEFLPLAGASVVIITNTSKSDKVGSPRTLRIMEERESIGSTVKDLGGKWVHRLDLGGEGDPITHAIWIGGYDQEITAMHRENHILRRKRTTEEFPCTNEALSKLSGCRSMDIPVVNISWLVSISKLNPGQHWSEVDVDLHKPRVMKLLEDKTNKYALEEKSSDHHRSPRSSTSSRRDSSSKLSASIGSTYSSLLNENPDLLEEDSIKRAMELSLLDFAIVHHIPKERKYTNVTGHHRTTRQEDDPYQVLRIKSDATPDDIKQAYRRRALETHPDKGGKPGDFEAVARAYRVILNASNKAGLDVTGSEDSADRDGTMILKITAHWDKELKEHRNLVQELYTNHGQDIEVNIKRQVNMLERLGLRAKDAGAQTINEKNERINNSCFYLSLACSYLSGLGALEAWDDDNNDFTEDNPVKAMIREADNTLIMDTALSLKRTIEAAVLSAHPEWAAQGMVGEEVQAFSDFLVYTIESQTIVSDWAVVVFDTCSGFVDVFRGCGYKDEALPTSEPELDTYATSNTITLQYVTGHYQPLLPISRNSVRPSLKKILAALEEFGVLYVVTDGTAK